MRLPSGKSPVASSPQPPASGWEPICLDCGVVAPHFATREAAAVWAAEHRQASGHTLELAYACASAEDDEGQPALPFPSPAMAAAPQAGPRDAARLEFTYTVQVTGQPLRAFTLRLARGTGRLLVDPEAPLPPWARLDYVPCAGCTLPPAPEALCPAAVALAPVVAAFHHTWSSEAVAVTVTTAGAQVQKVAGLPEALNSLVGLSLIASGCPRLAPLRPLVRFYTPFCELDEMVARLVALYAFAQVRRHQQGLSADFAFAGFAQLAADVAAVHQGLLDRLVEVSHKDAIRNALLQWNCYLQYISPQLLPTRLAQLDPLFRAYWEPSGP